MLGAISKKKEVVTIEIDLDGNIDSFFEQYALKIGMKKSEVIRQVLLGYAESISDF